METLNFVNVLEAKIQVNENSFGFISATIEINNEKRGNIFLKFGVDFMELIYISFII